MGRAKNKGFFKNSISIYFVPEECGDEKNDQILGIRTCNKEVMRLADISYEILLYFDKILNETSNQNKISVFIKPS